MGFGDTLGFLSQQNKAYKLPPNEDHFISIIFHQLVVQRRVEFMFMENKVIYESNAFLSASLRFSHQLM